MVTPGGGRAKETTHLIERFRLIDGGEELSVIRLEIGKVTRWSSIPLDSTTAASELFQVEV